MPRCSDSSCRVASLPLFGLFACALCEAELHAICGTPVQKDEKYSSVCETCRVSAEHQNVVLQRRGLRGISLSSMVAAQNARRTLCGGGSTVGRSESSSGPSMEKETLSTTSSGEAKAVGTGHGALEEEELCDDNLNVNGSSSTVHVHVPTKDTGLTWRNDLPSKPSIAVKAKESTRKRICTDVRTRKMSKKRNHRHKAPIFKGSALPESITGHLRRHDAVCVGCREPTSYAYRCKFCDGAVHIFCSIDAGEWGHGAHYTCPKCFDGRGSGTIFNGDAGNQTKSVTACDMSGNVQRDDGEDDDYEASNTASGDDNLSSSYEDENGALDDAVSSGDGGDNKTDEIGNDTGIDNSESWRMYNMHKKSFYRLYTPLYEAAKCSTHLINDEKYGWILSVLQADPHRKDPMSVRKVRHVYKLDGNVENSCVSRDGKIVTTFERVFDVIYEAHRKLGHARDIKKNKDTVNDDFNYYGVPRGAVKCFIDSCPMVSQMRSLCACLFFAAHCILNYCAILPSQCAATIKLTKTKRQPLKMILSKHVGSRYQMDLIEMPPCRGFRYILRVVDHLSLYGFVSPLKQRSSHEVGSALMEIMCSCIIPDILQSDNGSEVSSLQYHAKETERKG
jgi:hypothetical protein